MAASAPVVIASDQSAVHTIVDSSALPTGASTAARQDTGNTSLASVDTKLSTLITQTDGVETSLSSIDEKVAVATKQDTANTSLASIDGKLPASLTVSSTRLLVDGSGVTQPVSGTFWQATQPVSGTFWQATQPVSAASLPLPTGASTEATLSAASAKLPATLGQKAMTASLAVTLASDQDTLNVKEAGYVSASTPVVHDYGLSPVTSAAYVQLVPSLDSAVKEIEIFDSSGVFLYLSTGAAASEAIQIAIMPGGNGRVKLNIAAGTRIAIKAVSTSATVGSLGLNFYG